MELGAEKARDESASGFSPEVADKCETSRPSGNFALHQPSHEAGYRNGYTEGYADGRKQNVDPVDRLFTHIVPSDAQVHAMEQVREMAKLLVKAIHRNVPPSADRTAAFRKIREAVWTVNHAIVHDGFTI
jgi:hypothetical protein